MTAGGFPTFVRRWGRGDRAAVLIHCSLGQSTLWEGVAQRLSDALSMTAFDLPGHGRSGAWEGPGDVQAQAVAMAADLIEGQADLIGHSFGATVALRLAVERPALVRSLVLIEPVFFQLLPEDRPDLIARHDAEMADYTTAAARGDWAEAARLFTATWGDGRPWSRLSAAQRETLARRIRVVEAASAVIRADGGGVLRSGALGRLEVPVLLMEGAKSPEYIAAIDAGLAARIPGARRVVIPGAGHMLPVTDPEDVVEEIRRFLDLPHKGIVALER
ncbi:MAG: alpha/beta fold hydrolase [Rhodosalinus sp.]